MKRLILILSLILGLGVSFAHAQGQQQCFTTTGNNCIKVGTGLAGSGSAPLPVNDPTAIPAGTNYIGQVGLNAVATGGWSQKWFIAANSNNSTNLKASPGIVHAIQVFGIGSAPAYLKFYDKATAPTCGTDTPSKQIMIPAASTAANGSGAIATILDAQFTVGIGYCVVTGIAANDNTSPAAATFVINIDWN